MPAVNGYGLGTLDAWDRLMIDAAESEALAEAEADVWAYRPHRFDPDVTGLCSRCWNGAEWRAHGGAS